MAVPGIIIWVFFFEGGDIPGYKQGVFLAQYSEVNSKYAFYMAELFLDPKIHFRRRENE